MADISVGAAVGAGFELIGRKPLAVLAWGLVEVAVFGGFFALFAPFYIDTFRALAQQAQSGAAAAPNPAGNMPRMMMMQGIGYLFDVVALLVGSLLNCAAFRAVLHPAQDRLGYLRLGSAEFFIAALTFAAMFGLGFGMIIAIIPVAIIIGVLAATHVVIGAVVVGVAAVLALIVGLIYVALRFSLVGPMIVDDGKFHLLESWTLTRGKTGSLFLLGLSLVGVLLAAEMVIYLLALALLAAVLGVAAGGYGALPAFFSQPPAVIVARLAPFLSIFVIAAIPLCGCVIAVVAAPWARAYRDLVPAADASEVFT